MRITFVIPPSGFQLDERVYPMLGVLKVAAVCRDAGHTVDVLDCSAPVTASMACWQHWYRHGPSDVYGLTATMPQMPAAAAIARTLRALAPESRLILGGAHPTMVTAAARQGVERSDTMLAQLLQRFDCVVAGDGERAIFEAIRPGAPELIDADQPSSPLFLTPAAVATAPWPARDLLDLPSYHCWVGGVPATSVIAQLGCPFQCGFCGGRNSPTYRRLRLRPVADIVAELTDLAERWGYRAFMFLDDELNVSKAFPDLLRAIIAAQQARGESWRLSGLLKSELFTPEQADLMSAAGFAKVLIGFESGHPRILRNMRKMATVEDNTRAVQRAHAAGLKVKALMSLGHPGESAETIQTTRDWLLDVRPDEFDATVLTIYPGTPYHDQALPTLPGIWCYRAPGGDPLYFRDIDQFQDTPYYKGIPGAYESFVWTESLSASALVQARDTLESTVRQALAIPWPTGAAERQFEHSMGCR